MVQSSNEVMALTRVFLVRHCQASGNLDGVFQGSIDTDITQTGQQQLEQLRERFRLQKLDAVYSSPLLRARRTADAVNFYHGLPVRIEQDLREIDAGVWEGEKWSEFPVKYPEDTLNWNLYPWRFAPQGGEPMQQVYDRVWQVMQRIVCENPHSDIAVISHGCAIRNIMCHAYGYEIEQLGEIDWYEQTSVTTLEFDEQGQPVIVDENDTSHLNEQLLSASVRDWNRVGKK